jgi:hypothetical protein
MDISKKVLYLVEGSSNWGAIDSIIMARNEREWLGVKRVVRMERKQKLKNRKSLE